VTRRSCRPGNPTKEYSLNNALGFLGGRLRVSTQFDFQGGFRQYSSMVFASACSPTAGALNVKTAPLSEQAVAASGSQASILFERRRDDVPRAVVTYTLPKSFASHLRSNSAMISLNGPEPPHVDEVQRRRSDQ